MRFWLAASFFLIGGVPAHGAEPNPGLTSFEFWIFRPTLVFGGSRQTQRLPNVGVSAGPLHADITGLSQTLRVNRVAFRESHIEIDFAQSAVHIQKLRAGAQGSFPSFPKLSRRGITAPKWHRFDKSLYGAENFWFVVGTKQPLSFPLPDEIEMSFDKAGRLRLRAQEKFIAFLEAQIDERLSDAWYPQQFHHWFIGLPQLSNYLAESLANHFRPRALMAIRERLKSEIRNPAFLEGWIEQVNRSLPYLAAKDFTGIDATLEKHRFVQDGGERVAWRLRPSAADPVFCEKLRRQIHRHVFTRPPGTAVLAVHTVALNQLFKKYLAHLSLGNSPFSKLPPVLERHPERPWLTYRPKWGEGNGLVLFLDDYVDDLEGLSYWVNLIARGEGGPQLGLRWDPQSRRRVLDLNLGLVLQSRAAATEPVRKARLTLSFELENGSGLRLASIHRNGVEVDRNKPFPQGLRSALKFFVLQSLINPRLESLVQTTQAAMDPRVQLDEVHLLQEEPSLGPEPSPAQALLVDFKMRSR